MEKIVLASGSLFAKKGTACKNRCGFFCGCKRWGGKNQPDGSGRNSGEAFQG